MQQVAALAVVECGRLPDGGAQARERLVGTVAGGEQVAQFRRVVVLRAHQQVVRRAALGREQVGGDHRAVDEFEALQVGVFLPVLPETSPDDRAAQHGQQRGDEREADMGLLLDRQRSNVVCVIPMEREGHDTPCLQAIPGRPYCRPVGAVAP
ncbi:hypothetical protein LGN24_10610 [Burkholderia seminalis]|uniref:hypothetical protein n=1 Tax=Burkholderia seminalis TaxID=488731 RepID=UPI001CF29996|nr:hypothetical protein [Burkholderia seminalis]MCA8301934.1 hypothetical protein [Burkholderia seminalis]